MVGRNQPAFAEPEAQAAASSLVPELERQLAEKAC